ncbi:MAG: tRNA lysidine(34) synthetase TilS [Clostridia bacterium]|nr:tRNA lysidine(34) synthetase TilS [Clostridia bacterium]
MQNNVTMRVKESFLSVMRSLDLPKTQFCILLGFSGGADSSVLFSLLHEHEPMFGYTLHAVHVNHMIRGEEADRDERFCESVCQRHSVPFYLHKADVPSIAKKRKLGLEEAARDVRYGAYALISDTISKETGKDVLIATAHNADDNIETVLFNLVRGSALSGLCGISSRRDNVIRPLILSSKDEIIGYCEENRVDYITDSTNIDTLYTRNKLRHKVVPVLREINPSLSKAVTRMSASLSADDEYLSLLADDFIKENICDGKLGLSALSKLHRALRSRVIYSFLRQNGVKDCADVHVNAVIKLCENATPHSRTDLPSSLSAVIEQDMLCMSPTKKHTDTTLPNYNIPLEYGITNIGQTGATVARFNSSDKENIEKFKNIYKIFIQTHITSAKIKGALYLRPRKPGDVYELNGVRRKLKKLLWELESDPASRDRLPLFCDDDGILWVPGTRSRTGTYPSGNESSQILFYVKGENTR